MRVLEKFKFCNIIDDDKKITVRIIDLIYKTYSWHTQCRYKSKINMSHLFEIVMEHANAKTRER